jgi:hypothetical protein
VREAKREQKLDRKEVQIIAFGYTQRGDSQHNNKKYSSCSKKHYIVVVAYGGAVRLAGPCRIIQPIARLYITYTTTRVFDPPRDPRAKATLHTATHKQNA